jgi:hypothetical protein
MITIQNKSQNTVKEYNYDLAKNTFQTNWWKRFKKGKIFWCYYRYIKKS